MRKIANRDRALRRLGLMLGAALAALAGFSGGSAAQTLTTLYSFAGASDGVNPNRADLIFDAAGNLYGTTEYGGVGGTVFQLASSGTLTVLHRFAGNGDGANPLAGLIFDAAGFLYGTTSSIALGGCGTHGCGTVFRQSPAPEGTETPLYNFTGGTDGAEPQARLIFDATGNLYGTTVYGGAGDLGTVFQLAPDGTETVLYSFAGSGDGANPLAGLVFDAAGNLYGTTRFGGGSGCGGLGCGTVFKVAPDGTETVLYSFAGGSDGASPVAGLIFDAAGNLYGTTLGGGGGGCGGDGCGTVFQLAPDGTEVVLYSFTGGSDGANPGAGLVFDAAGNLYSTTVYGGGAGCAGYGGCGTVFHLAPDGTETVLYRFTDGEFPTTGLIFDAGNLYGTTFGGGSSGGGTVFRLTVP